MNVLQSMKNKLVPLGLYDLTGNNLITAELAAYALILQEYCDEIDELLAERFVSTASGRGLDIYENALGIKCNDESLAGRRKSVLAAISTTNEDNRLADMDRLMDMFGVNGIFTAQPGRIIFTCSDDLTAEQTQQLEAQMSLFVPVGVELEVRFIS